MSERDAKALITSWAYAAEDYTASEAERIAIRAERDAIIALLAREEAQ